MDIFNINDIFNQIDQVFLLPSNIIDKLTKYIMKLYIIFNSIQVIRNETDFYNSVDIFLYNLELCENTKKFIKEYDSSLITYKFHNDCNIQLKISLLFEYIIYDILDMIYSHAVIFNETTIEYNNIVKIMNNDPDFIRLNHRNKILFLDDNHIISNSYFKKLIKNIVPHRRMKKEFLYLLQSYFEYIIMEKIHFNYINNKFDSICENVIYKPKIINMDCNSQICHITV